jgi:hypothetical protein
MKKVLFILGFLLMISPCIAVTQGDYKDFKLGDTRVQVRQKINAKEQNDLPSLRVLKHQGDAYTTSDLEDVLFDYKGDKLFKITIYFPSGYLGIDNLNKVFDKVKSLLIQSYGKPTTAEMVTGNIKFVEWVLHTKIVKLEIGHKGNTVTFVRVIIFNPNMKTPNDFG